MTNDSISQCLLQMGHTLEDCIDGGTRNGSPIAEIAKRLFPDDSASKVKSILRGVSTKKFLAHWDAVFKFPEKYTLTAPVLNKCLSQGMPLIFQMAQTTR